MPFCGTQPGQEFHEDHEGHGPHPVALGCLSSLNKSERDASAHFDYVPANILLLKILNTTSTVSQGFAAEVVKGNDNEKISKVWFWLAGY